ncbi:hypothetical protein H4R21_002133, partial [Coemansia helicoidea]
LCNKCVAGYSHHCRFLNTCVGSSNYLLFCAFVVLAHLYSLLALACSIRVAWSAGSDHARFRQALWAAVGAPWSLPATGRAAEGAAVAFLILLALYMLLSLVALLALTLLLALHVRSWRPAACIGRCRALSCCAIAGGACRRRRRRALSSGQCVAVGYPVPATQRSLPLLSAMGCLPAETVSMVTGTAESIAPAPESP